MNIRLLLFLCGSLFLVSRLNGQISEQVKIEVDQLLSTIPDSESGIIIGITTSDSLIYAKGVGSKVLGKAAPLTPQTSFFLSSISKEFIGVTIAQLISQGKIDPHTSIRTYISEFPIYDIEPTIYQILHHSSGVKDYSNLFYFCGVIKKEYLPIGQIIQLLVKQKSLNFTPGSEYLYSNSNYELLAEVITRVTGEDFREYIRKNIFEPIGMKGTYYVGTSHGSETLEVTGYRIDQDNALIPISDDESPPVSVAQVVSTVNDMALWDRYLTQNLFKQDQLGKRLLNKGALSSGREIGYSLGFEHYNYRNQEIIGHGGFSPGFQSNHAHFKKQGFSIIIFSNSPKYNTYAYTYKVADIVLKNMGVEKVENKNTHIPNLFISNKESKQYVGSYYNTKSKRERVIYRDQGILRYNRPDQFESRLVPLGNHTFQMLNGNNQLTSKVSFEFNETSAPVLKFNYAGTEDTIEYIQFEYHNYKPKELEQFEGIYFSEELGCQFQIKLIDKKLELFRNGDSVSSLKVFKENTFRDNRLAGIFEFENDGFVKGFWLSQERARNIYFKKK